MKIKTALVEKIGREKIYGWIRILHKVASGKKNLYSTIPLNTIRKGRSHTFFGYYDISPKLDSLVLFTRVKGKKCLIGIYDLTTGSEKIITETNAWNWQQGCRLRWNPNVSDKILYNDFMNGRHVSICLDLKSGKKDIIDYPAYDVDYCGKYMISLDFTRLGYMRPGYGYTNLPFAPEDDLSKYGVDYVNLIDNNAERLFNYNDIIEALGWDENSDLKKCYINHLSFSPNGRKFMLFFIRIERYFHQANLLVYDLNTGALKVLEKDESVSHYDWVDNDTLIVTAYDKKRNCRYYLYDIQGKKKAVLPDTLNRDGHPTWVGNGIFVTDTYPDKNGFQKLFNVDMNCGKANEVLSIYSTGLHMGERRCDLHPRYDLQGFLCFDADVRGYRKIYYIEGYENYVQNTISNCNYSI